MNKIIVLILPGILSSELMFAQIATWSFNNVLTGSGSVNNIAGNASLGSTIAAGGAFNGGTVYYGEGAWPAGSIDMNAYLEFSITPSAGHSTTVSSLVMQIRRSTTGSSGAGPNSWSLRSSLDGYATDISSGVLTMNSTPAKVVALGAAFINLTAKIIFRLYGYNATVSSGGLNRFVYDDIQANGSTILPVTFDYFNVKTENQTARISWKLEGEGNISALKIERAAEGENFEPIKEFSGDQLENQESYAYADQLNNPSGVYTYRIQLISGDGKISYSSIQSVTFNNEISFHLQAVNIGNSQTVQFIVSTKKAGNYVFSLFNMNGNKLAEKSTQLDLGIQNLQMNNSPLKPGLYILLGQNGNQNISTKILIL